MSAPGDPAAAPGSGAGPDFEELDYRETPIGALALRRRLEPRLGDRTVYEVKLGDEFLMSSLFTAGEVALADLGLAAIGGDDAVEVVVGGLGLGFTAAAALRDVRVRSLVVVELLGPVIEWHRRGLVPLGATLTGDERCRLVNGDFFALALGDGEGFDFERPGRRFDAVLLDVDHSPRHLLHDASAAFYAGSGLRALQRFMRAGGVFAMWSNEPADPGFLDVLRAAFACADAHAVTFDNPYSGGRSGCTVYVAKTAAAC